MGTNGEEPAAEYAQLNGHCEEQDVDGDDDSRSGKEEQVEESKKTSDAILDELFSSIQQSGTVVDVAEAITEDSKSRRERATREKSRSRSRDRKSHKHKKNKKEKKHKRHRSRSHSNERKKRHRSNSSSPCRIGKTGTLADIKINTKSKNLEDLKNAVPLTSPPINIHHDDDDDDLPVGADYRTVMAEAVASSEPSTSHGGPSLADLPTAKKMQPAFPLKKSDGGKIEKRDPIEVKSSPMLKKVISEKGGAWLVPRKIQIDEASKNNGSATSDSFGPALPPVEKEESKGEEEEEVEMNSGTIKAPTKITFGQISLKVNAGADKKAEGNGEVKKEEEEEVKMEVDENEKIEKTKEMKKEKEEEEEHEEKHEEKDKKAAKKMAVRRRRSSSVEESKRKEKEKKEKEKKEKEKEKERKRSRSREKRGGDRDRDRSRDHRRDRSRSKDRRDRKDDRKDDRRRRSRSRSADRRRDDRDRDRDRRGARRSRSRERRSSRERERSKSREKIDKKKLLEIALQNARGVSGPVAEKQGVNMKILEKAGGRNIGDIVSYCQKLSETENAEKTTGRGDSDDDDFSYRNKKEIKLNIPGSKQLPTSTPQERLLDTAPLRTAFPVSSGVIHRDNTKDQSASEWKKVDASTPIPSVCTPAQKKLVATSSLNKVKAESEGKVVPLPSFPILPPPPAPPRLRGDLIPPPPPPPMFIASSSLPPPPMPPTIITPSYDRLIHMPESGYDEDSRGVRRKMDERSRAVNRLINDPNDSDAMRKLREIDDTLNNFGKTAELSGRWMGHTRVNLLSGDELQPHDPRFHAWVKKDLFKNTMPVIGGVGAQLMRKMGWTPGEGLGRERQGDTQPLTLDVKSDRKGLYSEMYDVPIAKGKSKGSKGKSGGKGGGITSVMADEVKNPISAMMELTQKKKWELPVFDYLPTRDKTFTCKVKINGFEFIGPVCLNKKVAKTECAKIALEKIGFSAPNVQTPTIYDPASAYSVPDQIVQARVRSALEAAELSAMPPPQSYIVPHEMAAHPPDKFDPAQIKAMQEQRDREKAAEPQPVPPPPPLPVKETEEKKTAAAAPQKQQQSMRGGRGRGRGRGRGGYHHHNAGLPPHMMRGDYPPFSHPHHHHGGYPPHPPMYGGGYGEEWAGEPNWENDFTEDCDGPSPVPYGEFPPPPPSHLHPPQSGHHPPPPRSYSSFPSAPFAVRPSAVWTPDDEFAPPPQNPAPFRGEYGRPPMMRQHSPAYEPYKQQQDRFY